MVGRFLLMTLFLVLLMLLMIETERRYRELQAIRVRQIYQRQVLLEEQSRLRLALQKITPLDSRDVPETESEARAFPEAWRD